MEPPSEIDTMLAGGAAAVLTTIRPDGRPLTSPVWVRAHDGYVEVVIAASDGKARNLRRNPACSVVVFGTRPPFPGLDITGDATLVDGDAAAAARGDIAARYIGVDAGRRFAERRAAIPSVLVRLPLAGAKTWDLSSMMEG